MDPPSSLVVFLLSVQQVNNARLLLGVELIQAKAKEFGGLAFFPLHCKKKVDEYPVSSRDVTYQALLGRE
jgi:hypothetical protein